MQPRTEQQPDEALAAALGAGAPRLFHASRGMAKGHTGPADTERFADSLMVLQECSQIIGERLGMRSVSRAALYEGETAAAFSYLPGTSVENPEVVGALVNRRMPLRELFAAIRSSIR